MTKSIIKIGKVASVEDRREHVKARIIAILHLLGSDGRNVLTKRDVNDLCYWLRHLPTMTADDLADFGSVENYFRVRHGQVTLRSATIDGEHRTGRERRRAPRSSKKVAIVEAAPVFVGNVVTIRPGRVIGGNGGNGPRAA
jgi:hypothetical protein